MAMKSSTHAGRWLAGDALHPRTGRPFPASAEQGSCGKRLNNFMVDTSDESTSVPKLKVVVGLASCPQPQLLSVSVENRSAHRLEQNQMS